VADTISGSGAWINWSVSNLTSHTLNQVVANPSLSTTGTYYWDNMSWGNWALGSNIGYCLTTTNCAVSSSFWVLPGSSPGGMPFYGNSSVTGSADAVNNITFVAAGEVLLTFEMTDAANWRGDNFGWYYIDSHGNIVETPLFTGAGPGASVLFDPPAGISYGFYYTDADVPGSPTWFSDALLNSSWQGHNQSHDQHFAVFSPDPSSSSPTYWIAGDDLPYEPYSWSSDKAYTDIVIEMAPVPEPGCFYLLGTGLLGLMGLRVRRRKHS
jgi:hypothetical protein